MYGKKRIDLLKNEVAQFFVFLCFFTFVDVTSVYSKEYRISQNGISFDPHIHNILNEIKRLPGNEPVKIIIEGGYYSISKTIVIDGGNHKISIVGSKNKQTVISGSIVVGDWESQPDGLWKSKVPSVNIEGYVPDQLFVNGIRATRSRTPNNGAFVLEDGLKKESLYGAKLKKEDLDMIPPICEEDIPSITIFRKWNASKRYLTYASEKDTTLYFSGIDFPSYIRLEKGNTLFIENTKGSIDTPGEWCADKNGYIYYLPRDGETIDETEFRIPIVEKLFLIQSREGLSLKNIIFEHTSIQMPSEGIEYVQAASGMSAAIEVDNTDNITVEDCEIRNVANYGIWLRQGCSNSSILKTYFHDLGAGGIKIGTLKVVTPELLTNQINIENNIIYNYGCLMESAVGVLLLNAADCKIKHNDIHHGNYSGISLGWVWGFDESPSKRNDVSFNRISHIGNRQLNDLGGIYTVGKSEGTHIHQNVISEVNSRDFRGWGIYLDEGTTGVHVDNNVTYMCTSGGFHQHYGSENMVTNNIFAWGEKSQLTYTSSKGDKPLSFKHNIIVMNSGVLMSGYAINSEKFVVGNNCYWSTSTELPKVGNNDVLTWINKRDSTSVFQNPCFRDPINSDFKFKKKTICKTIGFEPFNYSNAGVYGSRKWKKLAETLQKCE